MGLGFGFGSSGSKSKTNEALFSTSYSQQFSDEVLAALEGAFLGAMGDYSELSGYTKQLADEVMMGDSYDVQPIIDENTRRTEQAVGQSFQSLARQAGSDANSLVAAAQSQASADAYSALAKTSAELEMEAQGKKIADLGNALETAGQAQSGILGLGTLLKGGRTKSSNFGTGTSSTSTMNWESKFEGSTGAPAK